MIKGDTMKPNLEVLVIGATGQQGGAVAKALLAKGIKVRGMTRNPNSPAAKYLEAKGATIVKGDLNHERSLIKAMKNVDAVFGVTTPYETGAKTETKQGFKLLEAAKKTGVNHFVFSSVSGANTNTGVPHFDSKYEVEKKLEKSGLPYTIIAPVFFMENWLSPWFLPAIQNGNVASAMPSDRLLAHISVTDIGRFAAYVFENRDDFLGKRIELAGEYLTGKDVAQKIERHTGKRLGYHPIPLDTIREESEDWALMFEWFDTVGYDVNIENLRLRYPAVQWTGFDAWVASQDWSVLDEKEETTKPKASQVIQDRM
jgi:uncharacterized protein YbjT (DUF2867 family)